VDVVVNREALGGIERHLVKDVEPVGDPAEVGEAGGDSVPALGCAQEDEEEKYDSAGHEFVPQSQRKGRDDGLSVDVEGAGGDEDERGSGDREEDPGEGAEGG